MIVVVIQQSYSYGRRLPEIEHGIGEYWVDPEAQILFLEIDEGKLPSIFKVKTDKIVPVYHYSEGALDIIPANNLSKFEFIVCEGSLIQEVIDLILVEGKLLTKEKIGVCGRAAGKLPLNFVVAEKPREIALYHKDITFAAIWEQRVREKLEKSPFKSKIILHEHTFLAKEDRRDNQSGQHFVVLTDVLSDQEREGYREDGINPIPQFDSFVYKLDANGEVIPEDSSCSPFMKKEYCDEDGAIMGHALLLEDLMKS